MDNAPAVKERIAAQPRSMRVAVVTETYPPEVNGVAMTIGHMIAGLRRRYHSIELIRPRQHRDEHPASGPAFQEVLVRATRR